MFKKIMIGFVALMLAGSMLAGTLEDRITSMSADNTKGYLKPLANAAGATMNTGLYTSAKTLAPLTFSIKASASMSSIPSGDKTFRTTTGVQTATIFGNKGTDPFPDGANLSTLFFANINASLGLPMGNEVMLRYIPPISLGDDIGSATLYGIGLKHSIDQYIPLCPIDIAVQGVYQYFEVGDLISMNTFAANAIASKTILMFSVYGGVGYESASLNVDYTHDQLGKQKVSIDAESDFNMTLGFRYTALPLISIYGDYRLANYPTYNLGLSIGF